MQATLDPRVTGVLDKYKLTKTLGSGFSAKVKLAYGDDGKEYAIKIFDLAKSENGKRQMELIKQEVESTLKLNHKFIATYHEFQENRTLVKHRDGKPTGETKTVTYIVQEAILGGELYGYVANTGVFSEKMCRHFFKQMLMSLHYLHTEGFAHRDLKPENILLTKNYDLKLIDFGFAAATSGRDGSGFNKTVLGSPMYMAPEIINREKYQGMTADLFAVGVILFSMRAGHQPFDQMASKEDMFYKLIINHRLDLFWKTWDTYHPEGHYSQHFKDLISSMLDYHPSKRLLMADLIGHPWMQGEFPQQEEVEQEFAQREQVVKKAEEEAKAEKQAEKQQMKKEEKDAQRRALCKIRENVYLSEGDLGLTEEEMKMKESGQAFVLSLRKYDESVDTNTVIFMVDPVENVFKSVTKTLDEYPVSPPQYEISDKHWKLKYTMARTYEAQSQEGIPFKESAMIQVELLNAGERGIAIQFRRKAGSALIFYQQYAYLKAALHGKM